MADEYFENPRLAALYDPLDHDRSDLEVYAALAAEFGARMVLDLGCGTGTFACLLAARGYQVTGLDPAQASLDIARGKECADRVRWIHATADELPTDVTADLVTMTGNVAQVFLGDEEWRAVLGAAYRCLTSGGRLVFETRDPARQAWLTWNRADSYVRAEVSGVGAVESWEDVTEVAGEYVSFRSFTVFESDGATLVSDSTLRFRGKQAIVNSLTEAGFTLQHVREWGVYLDIPSWTQRMRTPPAEIATIEQMLRSTPSATRERLKISEENGLLGFTLPTVILAGIKTA